MDEEEEGRRGGGHGVSGGGGSCYEGIVHPWAKRSTVHSGSFVRKPGTSECYRYWRGNISPSQPQRSRPCSSVSGAHPRITRVGGHHELSSWRLPLWAEVGQSRPLPAPPPSVSDCSAHPRPAAAPRGDWPASRLARRISSALAVGWMSTAGAHWSRTPQS